MDFFAFAMKSAASSQYPSATGSRNAISALVPVTVPPTEATGASS